MHSIKDFQEIEEDLLSQSRNYSESDQFSDLGRTLLVSIRNLKNIQGEMSLEHFQSVELRHQFQEIFFVKGTNALQAAYWLLKHRLYDASYREIRYLYETYLLLKGLNDDKEYAADIAAEYVQEILILRQIGFTEFWRYEFSSVQRFHDIIREERANLEGKDPEYEWMYNYFSNKSMHPVRIEGTGLDERGSYLEEGQLLEFCLVICFGLAKEYWKTYIDTRACGFVYKQIYPLCQIILSTITRGLPTFIAS